jgi:hypothetical protein
MSRRSSRVAKPPSVLNFEDDLPEFLASDGVSPASPAAPAAVKKRSALADKLVNVARASGPLSMELTYGILGIRPLPIDY